ncbi:MAG: Chorismate synthase [Firmicutes bacterium ADurb.Bin080]|nr:chorismate synthase [Clostridiales bacterium]OQC14081.1 MAG: Chorismate synthase [Firmicutes bacterium ADurb.Bin080]
MKSNYRNIEIDIFGESHSAEIGLVFQGAPEGIQVDIEKLNLFLDRRKAGKGAHSTERKEADIPIFLEGLTNNETNGESLKAIIKNTDIKATPYDELSFTPRPSHADYVSYIQSGKKGFSTGGGRFSGRMTAPFCIAGYIAKEYLSKKGIEVLAYVTSIGKIKGLSYQEREISLNEIRSIQNFPIPAFEDDSREKMRAEVEKAKKEMDSVGGIIECIVFGLTAGIGDTMQLGMESRISSSVFGVPAVKAIEFGRGFDITEMRGSEANDPFIMRGGKVETKTNNSGGINGGISNGMPITLRVAIRPTPSIGKIQNTVNLKTGEEVQISIKGRHDACIVPRAVPCIESAVALAIMDAILDKK